jgi:pilus assembly protein CpaE
VQHTLGIAVYRTVPNSYRNVANSVNQGIPITKLAPRDPVAKTLEEMADVLRQTKNATSSKGWLSSFTGR